MMACSPRGAVGEQGGDCEHTTPVKGCMVSAGHSDGKHAGRALAPGMATEWQQLEKVPTGEKATTTTESTGVEEID